MDDLNHRLLQRGSEGAALKWNKRARRLTAPNVTIQKLNIQMKTSERLESLVHIAEESLAKPGKRDVLAKMSREKSRVMSMESHRLLTRCPILSFQSSPDPNKASKVTQDLQSLHFLTVCPTQNFAGSRYSSESIRQLD